MSNLRYLHQLLHQLDPSEIRILKRSLEQCHEKSAQKLAEFLNTLLQNPYGSESSLQKQLKLTGSKAQTHSLVRAITERIYDLFLLEASIQCPDTYDIVSRARLVVKKRILQIQILAQRQQYDRLETMLSQTEKIAQEYDFFSELSEILTLKQAFLGTQGSLKAYLELETQQNRAKAMADQIQLCRHLSKSILLAPALGRHGCIAVLPMKAAIERNEILLRDNDSKLLRFYHLLLQLGNCLTHTHGRIAHVLQKKLEAMVTKYPNSFSDELTGEMQLQFAYNALSQGDTISCKKYLGKARILLVMNDMHKALATEMEFLCSLHAYEFTQASQYLALLETQTTAQKSIDHKARISYYQACLFFRERNYREALKILNELPKFKNEHQTWESAARFLKVMALVENKHSDALEKEIENLRKHLQKCKRDPLHHARWDLMYALTKRLHRTGFQFKKLTHDQATDMLALATDKAPVGWLATGPELVPFHEWLLDKLLQSQGVDAPDNFRLKSHIGQMPRGSDSNDQPRRSSGNWS